MRSGARHADRRYRRRDGSTIPVETSNDFVAHGGREWISVFARDVTERRRLEMERAEQFTREQALRVRAEEASVLSEATRALGTIERNALAQVQIVNDLLDVSSIVLGTLSIDRHPVNFVTIVDGELRAAAAEAEQAGLTLDSDLSPALPPIVGDAARRQQIVRNLLSNAIKFTPPGGRVRVRVDRVDDDVQLVVSDTGVGIAPAFLPHVFDRFRQADSSMTRAYGGLGLGLAVVRTLVELHHGVVAAESAGDGAGATFTVRLPLLAGAPYHALSEATTQGTRD